MKQIQRLLSNFPPVAGDIQQVVGNYLAAVDGWSYDDVTMAVDLYVKGQMPGFDGRFAPTPPMLVSGCRKAAEIKARDRYLRKVATPQLSAPDIVHTPEERARVKAKVQRFIEQQNEMAIAGDESETKRKAMGWAKVNARFNPDMSDDALMARLMGFSVGSPESEENAA